MPILLIGNKRRQFQQLAALRQCRLNRANDPLSAYQREGHRTALLLVSDILKQEWSYLLLERRFLQDSRTFTETFTKTQVADKLLAALQTYEKCLSHQAADPSRVRYDLSGLERRLTVAIQMVHTLGQSVNYEAVERPKTSWKCTKEYEGWKASWHDMMNPLKGKLRVRERDVPDFGDLMDGGMTVTFWDEFGEEMDEVPLSKTLPAELIENFDQTLKHAGTVDRKMENEPQIPKVKKAAPLAVPQGRSNVGFGPKSSVSFSTKLEDESERAATTKVENQTDEIELVAPEKRPPVRLIIRRKKADLV
jgi:hypothetical protein